MTDYVSTFSDELIEEELEFRYGATSADYLHELKRALSHIKFLEAHSKMDKADIKNLENDLETLEAKNKELERTEVKLRESCQRLGERNRHLESLKTKADEMAEFYSQGKHYIFEYLDGSSTEVCIEFGEKADGYLEASKELDE